MTDDSVIIKKIGDIEIRLSDGVKYTPTIRAVLVGFGIPSLVIIYLVHQMLTAPEVIKANSDFYLFLWMIGFISLFVGFILTVMMNVGWKKHPIYNVFIKDKNDSYIQIKKTTPEQDQIEICKASQSLEAKARSYNEEIKDLTRIANNCK